jgi:hypothetical protein
MKRRANFAPIRIVARRQFIHRIFDGSVAFFSRALPALRAGAHSAR